VPSDICSLRRFIAWALVLPFLWDCRPTTTLLFAGIPLSVLGLIIRGWAAGSVHKDRELATSGPYAYLRNPLYLGTLLIGIGVTIAGGKNGWLLIFLTYFIVVYHLTIAIEQNRLSQLFGPAYSEYASRVPSFIPRLMPYKPSQNTVRYGFRFRRYCHNKEWEALIGVLSIFSLLAWKSFLGL